MQKNSHLHIGVIGNIASGKTTAAKILADALKAKLVTEPFIDNLFLPLFTPLLEFDTSLYDLKHKKIKKD